MPLSSFSWRALLCAVVPFFGCVGLRAVPVISQQPQSASVTAGQTASFSVTATGAGPLTYQWRRDGISIANATNSFFVLGAASQGDRGVYDVVVNDGQQSVESSRATLRVGPTQQPGTISLDLARSPVLEGPSGGQINQIVALPDGRFYVTGTFSNVDGQARARLARFNANGSLDRSFVPAPMDGAVDRIAAYPDGRLIVTGTFRTVGGVSSGRLVRLRTDGARDPEFAVGAGFEGTEELFIHGIAPAADGGVFLGVDAYQSYQGSRGSVIIKIRNDGTKDTQFALPSSVGWAPTDIALAPDGKIYATGIGVSVQSEVMAPQISRFLPNGSFDPGFNTVGGTGISGDTQVLRLSDGKIIVWGTYVNFTGSSRRVIFRLLDTGAIDPSFGYTAGTNEYISSVVELPNGDLAICGFNYLRRVKPDGSLDRNFTPPSYGNVNHLGVQPGGGLIMGSSQVSSVGNETRSGVELLDGTGRKTGAIPALRFPAMVYFLRQQPGGKIIVGGTFTHWDGAEVSRVVRLNTDLTLDSSFRIGSGPDAQVTSGGVQPDGKIILIGEFNRINGTTANALGRLNADGSVDTTFALRGGSLSRGFWYYAGAVTFRDGRIFIGSGNPSAPIVVLGADGTIVANHGFGAGPGSSSINGVTPLANGQILVGGAFSTWSGQNKPGLVRLNPDGTIDTALTYVPTASSRVRAFDTMGNALQSNGRAVISIGDRPFLVRVDTNGSADPAFNAAISSNLDFYGYLIQSDDRILTWGRRTREEPFFSRLNADGTSDQTFTLLSPNTRVDGSLPSWSRVLITDNGDILAAHSGRLLRYLRISGPVITTPPASLSANAGSPATLAVAAIGPGTLSYQWLFNGQPIAGATAAQLTLPFVMSASAGRYSVVVTNANGSTTSDPAMLTVDNSAAGTARLTNVSVRARVTGAPLITGFTVANGSTPVLVRAVGPSLTQFGITGALADPRLVLYRGNTAVDQNDNWGGSAALTAAAQAVSAFPLGATSLDAVLGATVNGSYTCHTEGPGSGVVLTEIYEHAGASTASGRITNVSTRYQVGTGENILIAGFTIGGNGTKGILVRGIGPTLTSFGVSGALADPQIALYSGVNRVAENNDWGATAGAASAFSAVGAFPLESGGRDAALVSFLPAGSYTVQLSGVGGATGEGLIEIYEIP